MGKMTMAVGPYQKPRSAGQFDRLLKAWQRGEDVTWTDLMTAWVKAPAAPMTKETILKIIHCLEEEIRVSTDRQRISG